MWNAKRHGVMPAGSRARRAILTATMLVALGSPGVPPRLAAAADAPIRELSATPDVSRAPPSAPGNPQKGAARAEALYCGVCHAPGGRSETPEWPSLAGQGVAYLEQQLSFFAAVSVSTWRWPRLRPP